MTRWAEDQRLRGPWRLVAADFVFVWPNAEGTLDTFEVPEAATTFTLAGPAREDDRRRLPAATPLTLRGERRLPGKNPDRLFQVLEGHLAGCFVFMESGRDAPRPLSPPVSDCPHQVPLHSAQSGQRTVWLRGPTPPDCWKVVDELAGYDDWASRSRPVRVPVGTRLRLRQADGLWIGTEFDNPGWYHLEVLDGPLSGRCVVVNAPWPNYELPRELRACPESGAA